MKSKARVLQKKVLPLFMLDNDRCGLSCVKRLTIMFRTDGSCENLTEMRQKMRQASTSVDEKSSFGQA